MKSLKNKLHYVFAFCAFCFLLLPVHAGRPLITDDAGINEKGHGHIEAWYGRDLEKNNSWHISPAYAPTDWLEITGLFMRDNSEKFNSKGLMAKVLFTPSRESGCNTGALAGFLQTNGKSHTDTYIAGLLSCNSISYGSVHFNLGVLSLEDNNPAYWGIAYEKPIGPVTVNLEYVGERYTKSITKIGLRGFVLPRLQLDGSIGRQRNETIFTIGMVIKF